MINFIFSPFLSLFSLSFYREMSRSSLGKGFLYLFYLSLLFGAGATFAFAARAVPPAGEFMRWLGDSLPDLKFTPQGLETPATQPFSLTHPRWGRILTIDTTRETVDIEEAKNSYIYLTKKKVYAAGGRQDEFRILDLTPQTEQALANWRDFTLTGSFLMTAFQRILPFSFPFVFGGAFVLFFMWKLLAALFYSLLAMLINLFRKARLSYTRLLNLSFFAMSAVIGLQWISAMFPAFPVRLNFLWSLLITALYLGFGILGTQALEEAPS